MDGRGGEGEKGKEKGEGGGGGRKGDTRRNYSSAGKMGP